MGWMSAICDAHKKVDVELLYNSVHRKFNQLETRCGRESQHPAEGALRPPIESWESDELEIRCSRETSTQRGWAPGPRLSSPGERERNTLMANRVGVIMLQFCSVSNSLSHTTLSIKWEVYFSKRLCRSSLLCRRYDSACICRCICIMCLYSWSWLYNIFCSNFLYLAKSLLDPAIFVLF